MNFPSVEMLPQSASWARHLEQEEEERVVELVEEVKKVEVEEKDRRSDADRDEIVKETPVYHFEGKSAAKLPPSLLSPKTLMGDASFTISFWFR